VIIAVNANRTKVTVNIDFLWSKYREKIVETPQLMAAMRASPAAIVYGDCGSIFTCPPGNVIKIPAEIAISAQMKKYFEGFSLKKTYAALMVNSGCIFWIRNTILKGI
jgi:UDP-N-acetylenolpyruvoylglucosamine reductase